MPATESAWKPDGSEIAFLLGPRPEDGDAGISAIDVKTGRVRTIVERVVGRYHGSPEWSPDGSRLAYVEWIDSPDLTARTHVMDADGTSDRLLPLPDGAVWQAGTAWSNDGTRILVIRGFTGGYEASRPFVVPVDGSGTGTEIHYPGVANPECCAAFEWAPDDTWILATPTDANGTYQEQVLLDPIAGTTRTLPWNSTSEPSVQRVAR
jgi:Tol biopolymer transport system component